MTRVVAALVGLLLALPVAAEVHLVTRPDGKKLIYNEGPMLARRNSDYNWLAKQRNRRSKYDETIERYSTQFGVDPVLVRAVIQVESGFNPLCVSNKGARGLMQLMPATAKRFGVSEVHDPEQNIRGGVRYLALLLALFRNDLPRTLAAYNAGENAVLRYGGIPPYRETNEYVARALTVYHGRPYGQGLWFRGSKDGPKLRGGFKPPVTATVVDGMRYLGTVGN